MPPANRRDFLRRSSLLALAPMAASGLAHARAAIDPIGRTRPSHLKLSLAAYSLRQYLDFKDPQMDMFGFVDYAADLGLDGCEPTSYWFPPDADADYYHRLQQYAFLRGLDISGTAVRNDFCVEGEAALARELEGLKVWILKASQLGAPVIRIFGGTVPQGGDEEAASEQVVRAIDAVLPAAVAAGVTLALENHGGITASPEKLLRLVRAVNAPNGGFGVNLDTGNFHGDDPYEDLAALAPYAVNVQVKTEISRQGKAKEPADLSKFIEILRDAKYSGYVVLEYEAAEDPKVAIPREIGRLQELIG